MPPFAAPVFGRGPEGLSILLSGTGPGPVIGVGAVLTLIAWLIARRRIGAAEKELEVPSESRSRLHK